MNFRESKHGGKILQHKNYEYWKIRTYVNKCVLWKCSMYQKCECTAHIITCGNKIREDNGDDHNHDPVNSSVKKEKEEVAVLETAGESGSADEESDDSEEDGEDTADQEEEEEKEDMEQEEDTDASVEDSDEDDEDSEGEDDDGEDGSNSDKMIRLLTRIYKEIKRGFNALQNVERDEAESVDDTDVTDQTTDASDETEEEKYDGDEVVTTEDYLQQLKKRRLEKLDDVHRSKVDAQKWREEMVYKH